jgi:hypothetical protein
MQIMKVVEVDLSDFKSLSRRKKQKHNLSDSKFTTYSIFILNMTKRRLSKSVIKDVNADNYLNKNDNKVKKYSYKRTKKIKTSDETNDERTETIEKNTNDDKYSCNDRKMIVALQEDSKRTM